MAEGFYSLHAQVISRGAGRSAVAAAAYRSGTDLVRVHRDGYVEHHDYTRRQGVDQTGIVLPPNAPEWAANREQLWCQVEEAEKRKDAQLCREFRVAFDHRMDSEQRRAVLNEFMGQQFADRGFAADWAIHKPDKEGDARNWHAHILVPLRTFEGEAFAKKKAQEYADWNNRTERLEQWRAEWSAVQNRAATRYDLRDTQGEQLTFDHRSYADREIDQEPTLHLGPDATALERRGVQTDIGNTNRTIMARNAQKQADVAPSEPIMPLKETKAEPHPRISQNCSKPQLWEVWDAAERRDARREREEEQKREQSNPFDKIIQQSQNMEREQQSPKSDGTNILSRPYLPANDNDEPSKQQHGLEL